MIHGLEYDEPVRALNTAVDVVKGVLRFCPLWKVRGHGERERHRLLECRLFGRDQAQTAAELSLWKIRSLGEFVWAERLHSDGDAGVKRAHRNVHLDSARALHHATTRADGGRPLGRHILATAEGRDPTLGVGDGDHQDVTNP